MKAEATALLTLLNNARQFVIPIYQRMYSWSIKECEQLWDDIIKAGSNDEITGHFMGSVVYIEEGLHSLTSHSPLLIIDGQQRLTTSTLLIAALTEVIGNDEIIDGFTEKELREYYLINPLKSDDRRYKLLLSETDEASLKSIVDQKSLPTNYSQRIVRNFEFFQKKLSNKSILETVCKGLSKLIVVDVALQRGQDNPQLIFESMNSTGKKLSQADLIRNFILMGLEKELQTELYNDYWRPMELAFGQKAYSQYFDWFMRHFLTLKTGDIPKVGEVYDAYKQYFISSNLSVRDVVKEIHQYAIYYCCIALSHEKNPTLNEVFHNIRELKVDVSYPLLLEFYADFDSGMLDKQDFVEALKLVESYVFRRAICSIPTNSMNKTFSRLSKGFKKDRYLESIKAAFIKLPSYRRFPKDEEFKRELSHRDLYNFRSKSYWLKKLENHKRKERVLLSDYTIEHIMPQFDNKPEKVTAVWKQELGSDWQRVWETWRHTLGNLTLTGYNSEYSNKKFSDKRDMEGGFKFSPLKLNEGLGQVAQWNEQEIIERAEKQAEKACNVWPLVELDVGILEAYQSQEKHTGSEYTLETHPHLQKAHNRALYQAFKKEVLELDPCVSEEVLKLYIAFKAETNFVDIVPQSKRLKLSINIPFEELDDPKKLCKDVSEIGRWGNGDVEVVYENLDDLPYIMTLVTQAFERQIDVE